MYTNKHTVLSLERQHLKSVRKYYLSIADINVALSSLHKSMHRSLDLKKYQYATEFIQQYISYTTVWNLKFVANLESPEVALMQIFHLDYIFSQEPENNYPQERLAFAEQKENFLGLNVFQLDHIEKRRQKMLNFIQKRSSEEI